MSYDLQRNVPYPLWLDPQNELHQQQQHFIMFALTAVNLAQKYRDSMNNDQKGLFNTARNFLDQGVDFLPAMVGFETFRGILPI